MIKEPLITNPPEEIDMGDYSSQAYLDYAMSVVCGRALPYLCDGQKPVQRRTLYAMNEMRLNPEGKSVKSAKIIGTVLGSYHPHGDRSVYDAMVRQSQGFVMRYPLVHGDGNFGSRDGDSAAAMRYCFVEDTYISTEKGLVKIKDLKKENTDEHEIYVSVDSIDEKQLATKWLFSGFHSTLKIKTSLGFETICTPNEPFYYQDKWVRADALKVQSKVWLKKGQNNSDSNMPLEAHYFFKNAVDLFQFSALYCSQYLNKENGGDFVFKSELSDYETIHSILSKINNINYQTVNKENIIEYKINSSELSELIKVLGFNTWSFPSFILSNYKGIHTFFNTLHYLNKCNTLYTRKDHTKDFNEFNRILQIALLSIGVVTKREKGKCLTILQDSNKFLEDSIESIEPCGIKPVYDLTVSETHAFIANGFIAHNTEAKLSKNSKLLLQDLESETVDFRANYDGTTKEPEILPSRLPFILMNGAEGVGVGMACSIPPHKASEIVEAVIKYLKKPTVSFDEIMESIKGPDFPTGGQIIQSRDKVLSVYKDGNGTLKLRGRYSIEKLPRNGWQLVIYELPYTMSAQRMMEQIDSFIAPKPKEKNGKKEYSQDQLKVKNLFNGLIDTYRDESGKEYPTRIVIQPKTNNQKPEDLVNLLLFYTGFQDTIRYNFVVVKKDKKPGNLGILEMVKEWSEFRLDLTKNRLIYESKVAAKRIHIIEGRLKIIEHIKKAIDIIQSNDNPKTILIKEFSLSEEQADDVLDMRLRQLAKLEGGSLNKEKDTLDKLMDGIQKILKDKKLLVKKVIEELEVDLKSLGEDIRKTIIEEDNEDVQSPILEKQTSQSLAIAISENFWIKAKVGEDFGSISPFRTGDKIAKTLTAISSQTLFVLDSSGKVFSILLSEIPMGRGTDSIPLASLWNLKGRIVSAWVGGSGENYIFASSSGHGFQINSDSIKSKGKTGKSIMTIKEGFQPLEPLVIQESDKVVFLASDSSIYTIQANELPALPKGKGVAIFGLRKDTKMVDMCVWKDNAQITDGKTTFDIPLDALQSSVGERSSTKKGVKVLKEAIEIIKFK